MKASRRKTLGLTLTIALAAICSALPAAASAESISLGGASSCAVGADNALSCWGGRLATFGILSLPDYIEQYDEVPRPVDGIDGTVTDVAVASDHKCAVVDGAAYCWGYNLYGQLGDGTTYLSLVAKPVPGFASGVTDIAVAVGSTCAVKSGAVSCWGAQAPPGADSKSPAQIPGLESGVSSVSTAHERGCAVVSAKAICWGHDADLIGRDSGGAGYLSPDLAAGLDSGVQAISVGVNSTCAIVNGGARCWGMNNNGQLGDGTTDATTGSESRQVAGLTSGLTSLNVGHEGACAVVSGAAKCWGRNTDGTHGDGTADDDDGHPSVPVDVRGLGSGVDAIAIGSDRACSQKSGTIHCWGRGISRYQTYPPPHAEPTEMLNSGGLEHIAVGYSSVCGFESGAVSCTGYPLTEADKINGVYLKPLGAPFNSGVTAISTGSDFCAIVSGRVRCKGDRPNPVEDLGSDVVAVASGGDHTCASSSTIVRCWKPTGWTDPDPKTIVNVGAPITALTSGSQFSCAIVDGGARCWGNNEWGNFGDSFGVREPATPVTPVGLSSGVTSIDAGQSFACAVVAGAVKCWGLESSGALGNGGLPRTGKPEQVTGLTSGAVSVAASDAGACALMDTGSVYCWGRNGSGESGNGTFEMSNVPVLVSSLGTDVVELAAHNYNTCARVSGVVKCWGNNSYGQLGIGTTFWNPGPVELAPVGERVPRVVMQSPLRGHQYMTDHVPVDIFANFEGTRESVRSTLSRWRRARTSSRISAKEATT